MSLSWRQISQESSTESEVPRRSSKTSSVRRPPETADTAEGQLLLEAFRRYDREDEGELTMKDVRSCLADIGIHPSLPPEKRAMTEVLQSAQPQNGLDFYIISQLVPKIWEAIALAKRQDLEYWGPSVLVTDFAKHNVYNVQLGVGLASLCLRLALQSSARVRRKAQGVQLDQDGRHWEAVVSRIGPPLPPGENSGDVTNAWRCGAGKLRVLCHEASSITSMALRGKSLCFGTSGGRIRVVDLHSGAKVGEYFVGSHLPSPISFLHFDEGGELLVAGDLMGRLHGWKAKFPGSWGYTTHPDISFLDHDGCAHSGAVTGLVLSEGVMISSSCDGSVSFWTLKDLKDSEVIHPSSSVRFLGVPLCLCGGAQGVFVGFKDGSVRKVMMIDGKCADSMSLPPSESGAVTALAFQSETLIVGFEDGQVKILRQGHDALIAKHFHSSNLQELRMLSEDLFLSSASDGRVAVWSMTTGSPLWGFRGLRSLDDPLDSLESDESEASEARSICMAADSDKLLFSGLVINPVTPANTIFINDWRQSRSLFDELEDGANLASLSTFHMVMALEGHVLAQARTSNTNLALSPSVTMAYYAALKLAPGATAQEIRQAYLERARLLHPDLGGEAQQFQRVQEAYDVLGDPVKRKAYDAASQTSRASRASRAAAAGAAGGCHGPKTSSQARAEAWSGTSQARQWVKQGQSQAMRWYNMPIPEFAWNLHLLYSRAFNRQQMPHAAFVVLLRQRYRYWISASAMGMLRKVSMVCLDLSADALRALRLRLAEPQRQKNWERTHRSWNLGWCSIFRARHRNPEQADQLRKRVVQGRSAAMVELIRQCCRFRQTCFTRLPRTSSPRVSPALALVAGALALGGSGSIWAAATWQPKEEMTLSPVKVFKVLGSEETLAEYNAHMSRLKRPSDWKAMYTQFMLDHALGTVPYRWDQNDKEGEIYSTANLVEVSFLEPLDVVVAAGPIFWDASVPQEHKAELVKSALHLESEMPLMAKLGQQQKALLMQETEAEWELIFSHEHLASIPHDCRIVASFQKSKAWPVTATWTTELGELAEKYVDDDQVLRALSEAGVDNSSVLSCLEKCGLDGFHGSSHSLTQAEAADAHPDGDTTKCTKSRWSQRGRSSLKKNSQLLHADWRILDMHGFYDMQQLRPCLEALGLRIHDEEWMEVERIFMPVCRDKKPTKKTFTKSVTKILFEQKMRKVKGPEKSPVHASDLTDFEVFQKSFFTVQEHLTRRRRRLERQLCEDALALLNEHQLTHEQIDEFRSDLVSLDFLFRRFDRHRRKKLTENEVLNLLVACGADSRLLRSDFMSAPHLRMVDMVGRCWGSSWEEFRWFRGPNMTQGSDGFSMTLTTGRHAIPVFQR
eukprot:s180_g43.t2